MKNVITVLLCAIAIVATAVQGYSAPRIIVLVIASDDKPYYRKEQELWRSYMHVDPEIKVLFLKANPQLSSEVLLEDDVLWSRCEETYIPGILFKTLNGFRYCLDNFGDFEYIFRTNLSSFCDFGAMKRFASKLPKSKCYSGVELKNRFISGAGFFLSKDMVELLVSNMHMEEYGKRIDDAAIGLFMTNHNIMRRSAPRLCISSNFQLNHWRHNRQRYKNNFHYRLKQANRNHNELAIYAAMIKEIYNISVSP